MASAGSPQPNRPKPAKPAVDTTRKPLQVMQINRRQEEQERLEREAAEARKAAEAAAEKARKLAEAAGLTAPTRPSDGSATDSSGDEELFDMGAMDGMTMADLLGAPDQKPSRRDDPGGPRSVDDFDFDEDAFLAALDENEPVGTTGEVVKGKVLSLIHI